MRLRHAFTALALLAACAAPAASAHASPSAPATTGAASPARAVIAARYTVPYPAITHDSAAAESLHVFVVTQLVVSSAMAHDSVALRSAVERAVVAIGTVLSTSSTPALRMAVLLRSTEPPNPDASASPATLRAESPSESFSRSRSRASHVPPPTDAGLERTPLARLAR